MRTFDPNAAAQANSGIFGLPYDESEADVIVVPVPFDATTSYRRGAARGARAVALASRPVYGWRREVGSACQRSIYVRSESPELGSLNEEARALADPIVERGGDLGDDERLRASLARVNEISERINTLVYE